ncbi:hypothetical protein CapIbe_016870 [Capra ibex]
MERRVNLSVPAWCQGSQGHSFHLFKEIMRTQTSGDTQDSKAIVSRIEETKDVSRQREKLKMKKTVRVKI